MEKGCYLTFVVEPSRHYRFRCLSEENIDELYINGEDGKKPPSVKLNNFDPKSLPQQCSVLIKVSLVTEDNQNIHPYLLKSSSKTRLPMSQRDMLNEESNKKHKFQIYYQINRTTNQADIDCLNVISIPEAQIIKMLEKYNFEQSKSGNCGLVSEPKTELKKYGDLNKCRLKIQAVAYNFRLKDEFKEITEPLYSNIIENSKMESISTFKTKTELKILGVSKQYAKFNGEEEIFVACSYIEHDDIEIEFYQYDKDDRQKINWLRAVQFNHSDVYHNCGVIFQPPVYDFEQNLDDKKLVEVHFRLVRPSDNQYSNEEKFYYIKDDSNFLNNYDTEFLKICAANAKSNRNKGSSVRQAENTSTEVSTNTIIAKKTNVSKVHEDSPKVFDSIIHVPENLTIPVSQPLKTEAMEVDKLNSQNAVPKENEKTESDVEMVEDYDEPDKFKTPTPIKPADTVNELRKTLERYEKKMNELADRTSNALLNVSETRSLYKLIGTQRFLLSAQNEEGNTPLHIAIMNSNFDILEIFVDVVATIPDYDIINMRNKQQLTPLLMAANQKESEVCAFLLESGAKVFLNDSTGSSCFHIACRNNDYKLIEVLLKYVKEPKNKNKQSIINKFNHDGLMPIHLAILNNSYKVVELLVESKICDLNAKAIKDGMSPLHYAAQSGYVKIVNLLLKQEKIIVDIESHSGCTPLHLAIMNKNYFVVRKLISANATTFAESRFCQKEKCPRCTSKATASNEATENTKRRGKAKEKELAEQNIDLSNIKNVNKEFHKILEYSKTHFNAYHYANEDEIMHYLFKNEKNIPKLMLNRILKVEIMKALEKASEKQLEMIDKNLKQNLENENFDVITYLEERIRSKDESFKFSKIEDAKIDYVDSLDPIYQNMSSLNINEISNEMPIDFLEGKT